MLDQGRDQFPLVNHNGAAQPSVKLRRFHRAVARQSFQPADEQLQLAPAYLILRVNCPQAADRNQARSVGSGALPRGYKLRRAMGAGVEAQVVSLAQACAVGGGPTGEPDRFATGQNAKCGQPLLAIRDSPARPVPAVATLGIAPQQQRAERIVPPQRVAEAAYLRGLPRELTLKLGDVPLARDRALDRFAHGDAW